MKNNQSGRLRELAAVFAKLGAISFGGPAAHIALMEREFVQTRGWLERQEFLDMMSISQIIPGPNSTELAIHIGYRRAGWAGLIVAGCSFILPAMLIVTLLAFLYQTYAALPLVQEMMSGIKPVIIAIIVHAVWLLAKSAVKNRALAVLTVGCVILMMLGVFELLVIAIAGLLYLLWQKRQAIRQRLFSGPLTVLLATISANYAVSSSGVGMRQSAVKTGLEPGISLVEMFLVFCKIGAVLYGSGYVLIAYLQTDFVERYGVLSAQQLLDAVTIGQFTPGPLFTTATFIGYLLHGTTGAWLATLAIFLPAFVFVALVSPWSAKLRANPTIAIVLDGINCASLAFIFSIAWMLAGDLTTHIEQLVIATVSLFLLFKYQWNSAWFVLAGALLGLLMSIFT